MRSFEMVEFGHRLACHGKPFFNYAWLLRTILHEAGLQEHAKYVKKLRCKERLAYYAELLEKVRHAYNFVRVQGGASTTHELPLQPLDDPASPRTQSPNS